MSFLSCTGTLCAKELRVLARDRQAAVLLFGMPAVFVLFLSLALQDVYTEKVGRQLSVVLEVEDDGELAREVAATLREGDLELVERPAGMDDAELFRSGTARAAVRIPSGFSADADALLSGGEDVAAGLERLEHRIEWTTSPSLDAAYRWLLEAQLAVACLATVQDVLGESQLELGEQLESMGAELDELGAELEERGDQLEAQGRRLESQGAEMESLGAELEARGKQLEELGARLAEAKRAEAEARAELEAIQAYLAEPRDAPPDPAELAELRERAEHRGPPAPGYERPADPTDPPGESSPAPDVAAVVEAARRAGELDAPPSEDDEAAGREGAVADAGEPNARTRGDDEAAGADPIAGPERDAVAAADDGPDGVAARARDVPAPVRPPDAGADVFLEETPGERATLPTPLQQTVPGWSLFAMFFIVVPLSHALHRERAEGTVRRILALAVPRSAIVAGKLVPYVLVGTVQFAGMLAVGLWVVPMLSDLSLELGLHPEVLLPITFACALAATSYALVVATLARTPEQAAAFGATSVVVLAVIGGVMVPHFVMPAFLQKIALASPLYWGHQAYLDAFLHGATLADLATPLAVLTAFALVCLAVATPRVGRA